MSSEGTVYRVYNADGELLYIGCSLNPLRRIMTHKQESLWWSDIARVELEHVPGGRREAFAAEYRAICLERPRFNKQPKRIAA